MSNESTAEYAFHWDGGGTAWEQLRVVSFHIQDAMSHPYEARIVLHARGADNEVDPETMVGALATLRIATLSDPAVRAFHGLIIEAAELGTSRDGMLYEVILAPPLARSMHRVKSRVFLEKTTKQILEAVLTGDPKLVAEDPAFEAPGALGDPFEPPKEVFAFRIKDTARIEEPKTRPYCVQYNESDYAFVTRLLAEEGISFHYEHHATAIVLVLSDHDDGRTKLDPAEVLGPGVRGRQVDQVRLGRRLRATRFRLNDFNWQKPALDMKTEAKGDGDESLAHDVYPGLYPDEPKQGEPLAKARLERLLTEARFAEVTTPARLLGAGHVFEMTHPTARYEGEYLVVKAEILGHAEGELGPSERLPPEVRLPRDGRPFLAKLECLRRGTSEGKDESKFRPSVLAKPRIVGTQTAIVTAEPSTKGAEIHVGGPEGNENGCVRLKFHWDLELERHDAEPTSCWVRVSQVFAGAGGGAVHHPRVGTEVIVDFQDGDPDRPIVVGRVYNGEQPPPANGKGAATVSTMKSLASPGGKVNNEFLFDDTAGEERVMLNAGKDWSSTVGNDRTEAVKNNSSSNVDVDRSEDTGANRSTHVGGNNSESVDGDESVTVKGNQTISVTGNQEETISGNEKLSITGTRTVAVTSSQKVSVSADAELSVTATNKVTVGASETYSVGANQAVSVTAVKTENIGALYSLTVGGPMNESVSGPHTRTSPIDHTSTTAHIVSSTSTDISASASASIKTATFLAQASGTATLQGATVEVTAGGDVIISGASVKIKGGSVEIEGGSIKIAGGTTDITGSVVKVN